MKQVKFRSVLLLLLIVLLGLGLAGLIAGGGSCQLDH